MNAKKSYLKQIQDERKLKTIEENRSEQDQTLDRILSSSPIQFGPKHHTFQTTEKLDDLSTLKKNKQIFESQNINRDQMTFHIAKSKHRRNKTQMGSINKSKEKDPVYNCLFVPFMQTKSFDFGRSFQNLSKMEAKPSIPRKKIMIVPHSSQKKTSETLPIESKVKLSHRQKKTSLPGISKKQAARSFTQIREYKTSKSNTMNSSSLNIQERRFSYSVNKFSNKKINNMSIIGKLQGGCEEKGSEQILSNENKNVKEFKVMDRSKKLKNRLKTQKQKQWKQINYLQLKTCYYHIEKKIASNSIIISNDSLSKNTHNIDYQPKGLQKEVLLYERNPKLPKLPSSIQQVSITIKNFKSFRKNKVSIDQLIQSKNFSVKFVQKNHLYFGQLKNQTFHGYGVLIKSDYIFEGEWKQGQKVIGVQVKKGGFYEGQFVQDKKEGFGVSYWNNGYDEYSGEWKNGLKSGNGVWKNLDGDQYIGQWTKGKVQGFGVHSTGDGQKYQGYFIDFLKQGKGKQIFPNKDTYEGNYSQGKPEGFGVYKFYRGKAVYEGDFKKGLRHGQGKFIVPNFFQYHGQFDRDNVQGYGKIMYNNNDCYIGNFKQGARNGNGSFHQVKQRVILNGIWKNGQFFQNQVSN